MCYELATIAKEHLDIYNKRPETLFESMTSRHKREDDALRHLRADTNTNNTKNVRTDQYLDRENVDNSNRYKNRNNEQNFKGIQEKEEEEEVHSPDKELKQQKDRLDALKQTQRDLENNRNTSRGVTISTLEKYIRKDYANTNSSNITGDMHKTEREKERERDKEKTATQNQGHIIATDVKYNCQPMTSSLKPQHLHQQQLQSLQSHQNQQQQQEQPQRASRYRDEFEEICLLGKGASGEVWKVRNKLDRRLYAVKKITMGALDRDSGLDRKIRREVTTVSRLLHKHIVRYFAAWVEEEEKKKLKTQNGSKREGNYFSSSENSKDSEDDSNLSQSDQSDSSVTSQSSSSSHSSFSSSASESTTRNWPVTSMKTFSKFYHKSTNTLDSEGGSSKAGEDEQQVLESSSSNDNKNNNSSSDRHKGRDKEGTKVRGNWCRNKDREGELSFEFSNPIEDKGEEELGYEENGGSDSNSRSDSHSSLEDRDGIDNNAHLLKNNEIKNEEAIKKLKQKQKLKNRVKEKYLFIQMEYCRTTLRAVVDESELWKKPADIHLLLRQILEALAYIHSRGMIHRYLLVITHTTI